MISMYLHNPSIVCDASVPVEPRPELHPDECALIAESRSESLRDLFAAALDKGDNLDLRLVPASAVGLAGGHAPELWVDNRPLVGTMTTSLPNGCWSWDYTAMIDNSAWSHEFAPFVRVLEDDDPGGRKVSVRLIVLAKDGEAGVGVAALDEYEAIPREWSRLVAAGSPASPKQVWVAAYLRGDDGTILVRQRGAVALDPGVYGLPGGKWEGDETLVDGLLRELYEETGFRAQADHCQLLDVYEVTGGVCFMYGVSHWEGELRNEPGHGEWQWVSGSDILVNNAFNGWKVQGTLLQRLGRKVSKCKPLLREYGFSRY